MPIIHGSYTHSITSHRTIEYLCQFQIITTSYFILVTILQLPCLYGTFSALLQPLRLRKKYTKVKYVKVFEIQKENSLRFGCLERSNCKIERRFFVMLAEVGTCLQTFCHVYFFWTLPEVPLLNWGGYDLSFVGKKTDELYQSDDILMKKKWDGKKAGSCDGFERSS